MMHLSDGRAAWRDYRARTRRLIPLPSSCLAATAALLMLACGGDERAATEIDGGAGDGGTSVCEQDVLSTHRVRVCARRKVGPTQGPVDIELSGPVLAAGNVNEFSPCAWSPYDGPGFWFEAMHGSGEVWMLGALIPGVVNLLKEGDSISAKASVQPGGFTPTIASLTLRDASGKLIAYAGEAGEASGLAPPDGIAVAQAEALCTKHDSCGDWSAYDLDVTNGGTTTRVALLSFCS